MPSASDRSTEPRRPRAIIATLLIGLGLGLAPVAFQMFHRAPLGGTMIDDFRPYMSPVKISTFRGYLDRIDAAESADVRGQLVHSGAMTSADYDTKFVSARQLDTQWPSIKTDMTDLLDRMDSNMGNYAAVAALPSFPLFPWFFLVPGVLVAGISASILLSGRKGTPRRRTLWVLAGLGLAIVAAPVAFQMFTRAPKGRDMIDSFRPMMTRTRVQSVQGYFITLGGAEGQVRVAVVPALEAAGIDASNYTAVADFSEEWPTIVKDFNPMIATMSDNVDNFQAVDALPSFALFPWFFAIPGALVAGAAGAALRRRPSPNQPSGE